MLSAPYPARSIAAAASIVIITRSKGVRSSAVRRHILRPLRRGRPRLRAAVSSGQILRLIVIMRNIEHPRPFCAPFLKKNHASGIAYFAQLRIWCMVCTSCYGLPCLYANGVNITGRLGKKRKNRIEIKEEVLHYILEKSIIKSY